MDLAVPSALTAVVVAGGDPVDPATVPSVPDAALVVAADSGLALAFALGLGVDVLVGDLDSASALDVEQARQEGAEVEQHPTAKDATDLELALDAAVARGATRLVVLGGHAGRLDHLLGNLALLSSPSYAGVEVAAHVGPATVTVIRDEAVLRGAVGDLVTLLPQHGPVHGVVTEGLRYPLAAEVLEPGSTRGLSNVLSAPVARVCVASGVLLAVQPTSQETS